MEAAEAFSQPMIGYDRVCVYSGGASALFCMASADLSPKATPRAAMRKATTKTTAMTYAPLRHRGGACNGNKDAEEDDSQATAIHDLFFSVASLAKEERQQQGGASESELSLHGLRARRWDSAGGVWSLLPPPSAQGRRGTPTTGAPWSSSTPHADCKSPSSFV